VQSRRRPRGALAARLDAADMSLTPDPSAARSEIWTCHLGVVPYADGVAIQERVRTLRQRGELPDVLLMLEHRPVYTRGRRSGAQELPFGEDFYRGRGIELHTTNRGGRVTYHGPGQLVGYPIIAAADVILHVRTMERAIVAALAEEGIAAHARPQDGPDYTGVWVAERKIASIGVHVSRGISAHGFAVNVDNDVEPFTWVIACGLPDVTMTSLALETQGAGESVSCFRRRMAYRFCEVHGRRQRLVSPGRLGIEDLLRDAAPASARELGTVPA
jgi:lipoate-protein ligase B